MTLEKGKAYSIRLTSGAWVSAEFLSEETIGGFAIERRIGDRRVIRARTRYQFRSLRTGRTITLRSMRKVKEVAL